MTIVEEQTVPGASIIVRSFLDGFVPSLGSLGYKCRIEPVDLGRRTKGEVVNGNIEVVAEIVDNCSRVADAGVSNYGNEPGYKWQRSPNDTACKRRLRASTAVGTTSHLVVCCTWLITITQGLIISSTRYGLVKSRRAKNDRERGRASICCVQASWHNRSWLITTTKGEKDTRVYCCSLANTQHLHLPSDTIIPQ